MWRGKANDNYVTPLQRGTLIAMWHSHRQIEKQIARLFTVGLSGRKTRYLWRSLARCPHCATVYEQYASAERALTGSPSPISIFSIERTRNAVFQVHRKTDGKKRAVWVKWSAAFAAVAGLMAYILTSLYSGPASHRVAIPINHSQRSWELTPRGISRSAPSYVGFRVFAIAPANESVLEKSTLSLDDLITFTFTYAQKRDGYLMLFGLQSQSETPIWYYPDLGEKQSIAIRGDRVDEPLNDGIALSVNHHVGELRIVSLFSDKPIPVEAVEKAVRALRDSGDLMNVNATLPLDRTRISVIEYSTLLYVQSPPDTRW